MPRDPETPAPTVPQGGVHGPFSRWFAFLGGAVAWTLHIMLAWAIAEFGCVRQLHHTHVLGLTLTAWLLIGLSVICLVVALGATWIGFARAGHSTQPRAVASDYLHRTGGVLNILFTVVILAQAMPIVFYLQRC